MARNIHKESGNCQGDNYGIQNGSYLGISGNMWTEVTTNQEHFSYMLDETTPVKACGELAYHLDHSDSSKEKAKEYRETYYQAKRRRMLQFDTRATDSSLRCEEISSALLRSNAREYATGEASHEVSQWVSGFSDASASSYDGMDQLSNEWLPERFAGMEAHFSVKDTNGNFPGASDHQINILDIETDVIQKRVTRTPNIIFKGRTSYIRTPTKAASSVTYPFAFIKPSGVQGDVTLKDINQRILTPPPSISKQSREESSASYPTSAFSGKPIVGKTKIRTIGGKGSINIIRTKG